jgi:hypothetical protein
VVQSQQLTLCLQQIVTARIRGGEGEEGGGGGLHFTGHIEKIVS